VGIGIADPTHTLTLRTFTDPMLNSSTFVYDGHGRLTRDTDAATVKSRARDQGMMKRS
jgi:YD repeat-containing protein